MHRFSSPDGGIGRRAGLKHQWGNTRAGSTPALGTRLKAKSLAKKICKRFFILPVFHVPRAETELFAQDVGGYEVGVIGYRYTPGIDQIVCSVFIPFCSH